MKLLIFSDVHTDARTAGIERYEEITNLLARVQVRAVDLRVDLVLFLGDLCDPDSGLDVLRASSAVIRMWRCLEDAKIPSVWMTGNHDVGEDGRGTTTLDALQAAGAIVVKTPTVYEVTNHGVAICFLPFVERALNYDPAKYVESFYAKIGDVKTCIVAGHLNLEGIAPGSETEDMARGRDVFFPIAAARRRPAGRRVLMLNGHIHRRQIYQGVHIPGSLARLRFDEEGNDPGFLYIDTEAVSV